ncbi:MAG: protein jag [Eubacteriales bacterium]|nr:protein jag [Eubacteriales bacterium]
MDFIESKGKTVDEAVFSGLIKMDMSIDEVDIEILDEGSGLFKSARVRLTKKQDASVPGVIGDTSKKGEEKQRTEKQREEKQREEKQRAESKPRHVEAPRAKMYTEEQVPVPQAPKNDAEKFLLGLFSHMGISVALESFEEDGILKIDMSGRSMGMLIGRRGETLDALQYLTSLVLNNGKEAYTKVMIDTENYRRKREDTLKRLAARLADKVQKSGRRVVLEPMNPYERRILHSTLQDYSGVYTYSEGEDPFRSVVVALKDKDEKEESARE